MCGHLPVLPLVHLDGEEELPLVPVCCVGGEGGGGLVLPGQGAGKPGREAGGALAQVHQHRAARPDN